MARNLRQKPPPRPPAKVAKRRGSAQISSVNLSDDEGYSAVEEISDSEDDDEENVNAAEEKHIITNGLHKGNAGSSRPHIGHLDDVDEEDDADDDDDEEDINEDEDGDVESEDEDADDSGSWDGIMTDAPGTSTSDSTPQPEAVQVQRHVRFVDVPSSDDDSTDTDDDHLDLFPDIFVDQGTLDPAFRRELEDDPDDSSVSSAFWDFHGPPYDYMNGLGFEPDTAAHPASDEEGSAATPVASQELVTELSTPTPVVDLAQDHGGCECE
jgi:hypothetical protein